MAALGNDFVPAFAEKDEERELIERYRLSVFPTFVWTDAEGEALAVTPQPDTPDDVLADLASMRDFLRDAAPK